MLKSVSYLTDITINHWESIMKFINNLQKRYKILVSLDVHQSNIYLYALNRDTGEVLEEKNYRDG